MNIRLAALGISSEMMVARGLRECEEAPSLEVAEIGTDGRDHLLIPSAAAAWRSLKAAALSCGIDIFIVSAFRDIDRQFELVRRKLEAGASIDEVLSVCAPPGYSEHHTGRAVDVSTPGSRALATEFDQTSAYAWLEKHASEFGYHLSYPVGNQLGYQYEPWHWCFQEPSPSLQGAWRKKPRQAPHSNVCLSTTMSASNPIPPSPTTGGRAGPGAIALFVVLALASAYASLMFWILGVGVPRSTHNVMALLFIAINVACIVGGSWCLKRGKRLAGIGASLAALPACIGVVVLAAYVFHV